MGGGLSDEELRSLVLQILKTGDQQIYSSFLEGYIQYRRTYADLRAVLEHLQTLPSTALQPDKIGVFIIVWAQYYPETIGNLKSRLLSLCEKVFLKTEEGEKSLNQLKLTLLKSDRKPLLEPCDVISVLESKPSDIAIWMTMVEWNDFKFVTPRELINKNWQSDERDVLAPHLNRMANRFNEISLWCVRQILARQSPQTSFSNVERLIHVLSHLISMNNFQSAAQISSALNHSGVSRLKKAVWNKLSSSLVKEFNECNEVVSIKNNYAQYRLRAQKCIESQRPLIPYIAVFLRDATYICDGNSDKTEDGQWNLTKILQLGELARTLKNYQKVRFTHQTMELASFYYNHLPPPNKDSEAEYEEFYKLSLTIEPPHHKLADSSTSSFCSLGREPKSRSSILQPEEEHLAVVRESDRGKKVRNRSSSVSRNLSGQILDFEDAKKDDLKKETKRDGRRDEKRKKKKKNSEDEP